MNPKFFLLYFLFFCLQNPGISQIDIDVLPGEWLVQKIVSLDDGTLTNGKHSGVNQYLKFRFSNDRLSITNFPLDQGLSQPYSINDKLILLKFPAIVANTTSEKQYEITELTSQTLVLRTINRYGKEIEYTFERSSNSSSSTIIDYGLITIKKLIMGRMMENVVYDYTATNQDFRHGVHTYLTEASIGSGLANIKFPKDLSLGDTSPTIQVQIEVDSSGRAQSVSIINSFNSSVKKDIEKLFMKSKWIPLSMEGKPVDSEIHLSIRFKVEKGGLGSN